MQMDNFNPNVETVFNVKGFIPINMEHTSFFSFSINLSTRWEPMNPAPPVTKIRRFDCHETNYEEEHIWQEV